MLLLYYSGSHVKLSWVFKDFHEEIKSVLVFNRRLNLDDPQGRLKCLIIKLLRIFFNDGLSVFLKKLYLGINIFNPTNELLHKGSESINLRRLHQTNVILIKIVLFLSHGVNITKRQRLFKDRILSLALEELFRHEQSALRQP